MPRKFLSILSVVLVLLLIPGCSIFGAKTKLEPSKTLVEKVENISEPEWLSKKVTTIRVTIPDAEDADVTEVAQPEFTPEGQTELEIQGNKVNVPWGAIVDIRIEEVESGKGKSERKTGKATAMGPGLLTRSDSIDWSAFETQAPNVSLTNGASAKGGALEYAAKGIRANSGPLILYGIGGIAILVGVLVTVFIKRIGLGLGIAGGGVAVIAVATLFVEYPWVVLVAAAIALAFGCMFVYSSWKGKRVKDTLTTVVRGIEKAPEPNAIQIKDSIKTEAQALKTAIVVKSEVTKLKRKEGLGVST